MPDKRLVCCTLLIIVLSAVIFAEATELSLDSPSDLKKLSLEELMEIEVTTVYSASKYEQKVTEAPSSVSIITSDQIKKYGYRTLADILRSIRGFFITYDRNYSYAGVRGFGRPGDYNARILVLVDGHRVNDNIFDGALIGTEFILDLDLIDRIEVIRGPGSSLYGTNAFFGVINIITKKVEKMKGLEVSGDLGSYKAYKGRASFGTQFRGGPDMLLSGSFYESKGQQHLFFKEFDDPSTNNGIAQNVDKDLFYNLFSKISFHGFTLEGAHISREKVIPTASFGTVFNSPRNRTKDEQSFLDLKYEYKVDREFAVMAKVYYDRYYYHGDYLYNRTSSGSPSDLVLIKDFAWGYTWGGELQFTKRLFEIYQFILGAEYRDNFRQDQKNYDEHPYLLYLDDRRHSRVWALYLQTEFPILSTLRFNAGVRYDYYDTFGGTVNPRLALIYHPFEKTFFKILYGEAFRAPNAYELYYNDGGNTMKSNPDLKPETIKTYELVWEQYIGNHFLITASGYYYKIKNLINLVVDLEDGLLVYRNVDKVNAKGLELELEGRWENGLKSRVSYSFQEAEDEQTGRVLTNSPKHLVKFNLTVPIVKNKLFAGIEEQYMSKRKTLAGNEAGSFFVTNLTFFSQNLLKGMEMSASVYNLFDKKYNDPGAAEHVQDLLEQDGRSFRLKVTYKF